MKLKNVKVGDLVEAKVDIVKRRFASESLIVNSGIICKVISKECADYTGWLSVFIESEGIKIWCNHKDLRKHLPKLKTLDQSVFDELDEKWRFAAVDEDGRAHRCTHGAEVIIERGEFYCGRLDFEYELIGAGYDTTNWQNSLIERDKVELTSSDYYYSNITSGLLENGSKLVVCFVSNISESDALSEKRVEVITSLDVGFNDIDGYGWQYVVPINNQGDPLTQTEVRL